MIDIHCHILPKVDDGSKSMKESIEMAKIAQDEGIKTIVATPHYHPSFNIKKGKELEIELENLKKELEKENIDIEILLGNELYYTREEFFEILDKKEFYTINKSRYLLVEFNDLEFNENIKNIIYEIKLRGYIPILAHVERYSYVRENPKCIKEFIDEGAIIQINASSITDTTRKNTNRTCKKLLEMNLVHVISTDAHGVLKRDPRARKAYTIVKNKYTKRRANELFRYNPTSIILNEDIQIRENNKKFNIKKIFNKILKNKGDSNG